jgi:hypothetical protein
MNLSMGDVDYHMKFLRYYRRLVEIKTTERDVYASFGGDATRVLKARQAFRKELMDLFKECKG